MDLPLAYDVIRCDEVAYLEEKTVREEKIGNI